MSQSDFNNISMPRSDFNNSSMSRSDVNISSMSHSDLNNSSMSRSDFNNSSMSRSDVNISSMSRSDFNNSSMSRSDLNNSNMSRSDLNISVGRSNFIITDYERGVTGMSTFKTTYFDRIFAGETTRGISHWPAGYDRDQKAWAILPQWNDPITPPPFPTLGDPMLDPFLNSLDFKNFLSYLSISFGFIAVATNTLSIIVALSRSYKVLNKSILVALSLSNITFAVVESLHQLENLLILHDVFLANLIGIYYFDIGEFVHAVTRHSTVYSVVLLVTERWVTVTLPRKISCLLTHLSLTLAQTVLLVLWAGVGSHLLFTCGVTWLTSHRLHEPIHPCHSYDIYLLSPFHNHLKLSSAVTNAILPFLLMIAACIPILIKFARRCRNTAARSQEMKTDTALELRLTKMTMMMFAALSFLVLFPYSVFYVVYRFNGRMRPSFDSRAMNVLGIFFNINSCLSFAISFMMNRDFRKVFKSRFCCCDKIA